jgi:hypothetical protein
MRGKSGFIRRAARGVHRVGQIITGKQTAGRNLTVFDDDVFVVSYPRSGNTWTRFLIGNLIKPDDPLTFSNVESRIPEIYFNPDHTMRALPRPRVLKSHESFQPHYPSVIYIVRDPRDVAVSYYHHAMKWGNVPDDYPMEDFIPRFIRAEFDRKWGSWADNVLSWLYMRETTPSFLLLRYEDMKKNTVAELERVANFLERARVTGVNADPKRLQRAVELSSPERMRELEKTESKSWVLTKQTRQDKPFVRSATSGGWKSALSPASVALLETAWGDVMKKLSYPLQTENFLQTTS